jgi:hypothetical protein
LRIVDILRALRIVGDEADIRFAFLDAFDHGRTAARIGEPKRHTELVRQLPRQVVCRTAQFAGFWIGRALHRICPDVGDAQRAGGQELIGGRRCRYEREK